MKFGLASMKSSDGDEVTRLISLGSTDLFDSIWFGDDLLGGGDAFTAASIVALRGFRKGIGIGVTSPLARSVEKIVQATQSLVEVAANTVYLGLGVGGLSDLAGLAVKKTAQVERFAAAVEAIKNGLVARSIDDSSKTKNSVKLILGVRGPRLLYLSGRLARGVLLSGTSSYLAKALSIVRKSLSEFNRPTNDFEFILWRPAFYAETKVSWLRSTIAHVIADTPMTALEMAEVNLELCSKIRKNFWQGNKTKAAELVPVRLAKQFCFDFSNDSAERELELLHQTGMNRVLVSPPASSSSTATLMRCVETWR